MEEKQAERVSILLMNPQNGEIYACVNVPEFDLNDPFTLTDDLNMQLNESGITIPSEDHNEQSELAVQTASGKTNTERKQELLNQMWRNPCLNDTYEPGSTFKIITMAAGLEAGVVSLGTVFIVPDIKWWRIAESTVQKEQDMDPRILWKVHRIPVTLCL